MTEQQIPESVLWALNVFAHQRSRAVALSEELTRIDSEIAVAEQKRIEAEQKALQAGQYVHTLREVYAAKGREHQAVHTDAGRLMFMVEQVCDREGMTVPQPPADPPLTSTGAFPVQQITAENPAPGLTPCEDDPPRCEACTGDRCGHQCHAQQAALNMNGDASGQHALGQPVAGHTVQATRPQEVEPQSGPFHPGGDRDA